MRNTTCAPCGDIAQGGYGEATADAVAVQVMEDNRRGAQDAIVRVRTEARKSPSLASY